MFKTNLTTLLSVIESVLIFLYLIFLLILHITGLIFSTLSIVLFVMGIVLTILNFTIYKDKKLKLILSEQITDLELFFSVIESVLIFLYLIFLLLKLSN